MRYLPYVGNQIKSNQIIFMDTILGENRALHKQTYNTKLTILRN